MADRESVVDGHPGAIQTFTYQRREYQCRVEGGCLRRAFLICVLCLLGGTACPAFPPAGAEEPPGSPDLFIFIADIEPLYNQTCSTAVWSAVNITAAILFFTEPGVIQGNVTFYANGTPLGSSPVVDYLVADIGRPGAWFLWDTGSLRPGNYTIRAELNASGDANLTNIFDERNFTLGSGPPALSVEFDKDLFTATPSYLNYPTNLPTTVACGYGVRAANIYGRHIVVFLNATMNNGWSYQLSTHAFYISSEDAYPVNVYVEIPRGARADRPGVLTLTAWTLDGGLNISAASTTRVVMGGSYTVMLDSDKSYIECAPGEEVEFSVRLTNGGNAYDSFSLEIINGEFLDGSHETASLSCRTVENLGPGETESFKVRFRGSRDWTLYKSEPSVIIIKASSLGARTANQTIALTYPVYVYEKGSYPAWYNFGTAGLAIIIPAVAGVAALWRRRRKRKMREIHGKPEVKA
jgi:hypothetical protein